MCITNELNLAGYLRTHAFSHLAVPKDLERAGQVTCCLCLYRDEGKFYTLYQHQSTSHLFSPSHAGALPNKRSVQVVAEAAVLRRGPWHVELHMLGPGKPERVGIAHRSNHYWRGA